MIYHLTYKLLMTLPLRLRVMLRSLIRLDPSQFLLFTISSLTDNTGYFDITVSPVDSSDTNPFSANEDIIITFARTGDKGDTGAQGVQGAAGAQGNQGHQGVVGAQGNQGHQGVQGTAGAQGNQGHQGVVGAQGSPGKLLALKVPKVLLALKVPKVPTGSFSSGSDADIATLTISNGSEQNAIRTNSDGKLQFLRNAAVNNTVAMTIDDANGNIGIGD